MLQQDSALVPRKFSHSDTHSRDVQLKKALSKADKKSENASLPFLSPLFIYFLADAEKRWSSSSLGSWRLPAGTQGTKSSAGGAARGGLGAERHQNSIPEMTPRPISPLCPSLPPSMVSFKVLFYNLSFLFLTSQPNHYLTITLVPTKNHPRAAETANPNFL